MILGSRAKFSSSVLGSGNLIEEQGKAEQEASIQAQAVEDEIDSKAPINNPTFTGDVTVSQFDNIRTALMENPQFSSATTYTNSWTPSSNLLSVSSGSTGFEEGQSFSVISNSTGFPPTLPPWRVFDKTNEADTRWVTTTDASRVTTTDSFPLFIGIKYPHPVSLQSCTFTSGYHEKVVQRVPTSWSIDGSNDGQVWYTVQQVSEDYSTSQIPVDDVLYDFAIDEHKMYKYWRMNILNTTGGVEVQIAELIFRTRDTVGSMIDYMKDEIIQLSARLTALENP